MLDALYKQSVRGSFIGFLSGFVIVTAKINCIDMRVIYHHPPQDLV